MPNECNHVEEPKMHLKCTLFLSPATAISKIGIRASLHKYHTMVHSFTNLALHVVIS